MPWSRSRCDRARQEHDVDLLAVRGPRARGDEEGDHVHHHHHRVDAVDLVEPREELGEVGVELCLLFGREGGLTDHRGDGGTISEAHGSFGRFGRFGGMKSFGSSGGMKGTSREASVGLSVST